MRLIDADKIVYSWQVDADGQTHDGITLQSIIKKMPTIEEHKRGQWIDIDSETYTWKIRCDQCGHERSMMSTQGKYPNFCEECGADMRGGV